jgi:hypothetical protein
MDRWAHKNGVELHFIQPGKPTQSCYIESFNGKFRDECLNENWFVNVADARRRIETTEGSTTKTEDTARSVVALPRPSIGPSWTPGWRPQSAQNWHQTWSAFRGNVNGTSPACALRHFTFCELPVPERTRDNRGIAGGFRSARQIGTDRTDPELRCVAELSEKALSVRRIRPATLGDSRLFFLP